jgi:hypothetical protein
MDMNRQWDLVRDENACVDKDKMMCHVKEM